MIAAKEEAPSAGAAWGSNRNGTNDGDGVGLSQLKRLATAQARAALQAAQGAVGVSAEPGTAE